jgi:O-antigen/teichoic acid export membrane protein
MITKFLDILKSFFQGHERTVKAKKNIIASVFIKGLSMVVGFLIVRITLNYLDETTYGIWLTLTSFLAWFSFFEVGLGNGLKNKLAEALAVKDYKLGKIYVSTTYAILTIIVSAIAILFFVGNFFFDWTVILNTDKELLNQLTSLTFIVFGFFFLRFVLQLINIVLFADQRPAIANVFGPIGNLIVLIIIYVLTITTKEGSLVLLGWVLSVVPVLVLIIATIFFYNRDYKNIAPSIKYVKMEYAKDLLNLGIKFFFIQVVGLIVYQTSNIIIAQYFGPADVTVYNIGYKYFSILIMAFNIIVAPFWAAYTEAWVKKDIDWIRSTVKKLLMIWGGLAVLGIVMLLFAEQFYFLWIGDKVKVPFKLSLALLIYFITYNFGGIFVMFINGVGKIKLQMYSSAIGAIVYVLVALVLIKYYDVGMIGLVIASVLSNFYGLILAPIQYKKLINQRAKGIWLQ